MTWEQILNAFAVSVPLIIGLAAYRQSRKKDAISAQSGVASNHRAGTAQIIEGLNALIDQLQEENGKLRTEAENRAIRLEKMTLEVARLRRKYGNGE